jgi:hypothetical protein
MTIKIWLKITVKGSYHSYNFSCIHNVPPLHSERERDVCMLTLLIREARFFYGFQIAIKHYS